MNIITLHGKARYVWRSWDFIVSKLGHAKLGELVWLENFAKSKTP